VDTEKDPVVRKNKDIKKTSEGEMEAAPVLQEGGDSRARRPLSALQSPGTPLCTSRLDCGDPGSGKVATGLCVG
jgi:hypothetical protein